MKNFLIISVGPVPTSKESIVEGGGLRAWGIAKGLNSHGIKVTVAVPEDFPLEPETTGEGIKVCNWSFSNLKGLCEKNDSVYVLYSRGDLMKFVATEIDGKQPLVVDLYVPIYIESLARNTRKDFTGLTDHLNNVDHWNYAFPRGDYFLCANNCQYHLYNGTLSAFGRINPVTYDSDLLNIVPFGVHEEKPVHDKTVFKGKIIGKDDFMILWFGGIYPWFDIHPLLDAVEKLSQKYSKIKLVILGGRNPFVGEPEFIDKYESVVKYCQTRNTFDKSVFFVDWIPYEERGNWYLEADLLVNLHNIGIESIYAWRTRVVDFIWGELPMLTSGGDELSESLVQKDAAIILDNNSAGEIYKNIEALYNDQEKLTNLKENMIKAKSELYWGNITLDLANFIKKGETAPDRNMLIKNGLSGKKLTFYNAPGNNSRLSKIKKSIKYGMYVLRYEGFKPFIATLKVFIRKRILTKL
jgi:glycosyltransferase involved in cell wall biosynthesis